MKCTICETGMCHLTQDLFICNACGLISSNIKADPSIYDKSYLLKYQRYAQSQLGVEIQALRYAIVKRHIRDGTLLDFGCGAGSFVTECNKNGICASGFDINPYGNYLDLATLFFRYKAVTFWDCLEHLPNPKQVVSGLQAEYVFACTPCFMNGSITIPASTFIIFRKIA